MGGPQRPPESIPGRSAYRQDQQAEAWERSAFSRGGRARPAAQWRWIPYGNHALDPPPLQLALSLAHLVDRGAGSTWEALRNRGLVLTRQRLVAVSLGPALVF